MSRWLVPFLIVLLTSVAFLPVLQNGFVDWDDNYTLVDNPYYRGLGWQQLRWMFTSPFMGHYQPLSWVTFGLDYLIWGMDPFGYHLSNLLLHAANAALFYFVSLRLLSLSLDKHAASEWLLKGAAAVSALVFAIHPLRVESVAWATERRDVLSGFFLLATVLSYLKLAVSEGRPFWLKSATLLLYFLSLLSKAVGILLPIVLLALDVYPLRRLGGGPGKWIGKEARKVLWEKLPFLALALVAGLTALLAQHSMMALRSYELHSMTSRLAQGLYGAAFYLWKTILPVRLSPLYELPSELSLWEWRVLLSGGIVLLMSIGLLICRHWWPAGLAVWFCYLVILAPVLGIAQSGPQLVADRYSYLSCLGWAALAGAGSFHWWRCFAQANRMALSFRVTLVGLVLLMYGVLTWRQIQVWRNTETLWRHALAIDKESRVAHNNLGAWLARQGNFKEAIDHYREAIRIYPDYVKAHYNLANALADQGDLKEATQQYQEVLRIQPDFPEAHNDLGDVLAKQGRIREAIDHFYQVVQIDPSFVEARSNLGKALVLQGELVEAIEHFRKVLELANGPELQSQTHFDMGAALAKKGDLEEATSHFQQALKINPDFAEAYHYLGRVVAAQGDLNRAIGHFREALRIQPEFAQAHQSLGQALAEQGKTVEAAKHFQEALRIMKSRSSNTRSSP